MRKKISLLAFMVLAFGVVAHSNAGTDMVIDNYAQSQAPPPPPPRPVFYVPPPPIRVAVYPVFASYPRPVFGVRRVVVCPIHRHVHHWH
jgi:hypothetical protein